MDVVAPPNSAAQKRRRCRRWWVWLLPLPLGIAGAFLLSWGPDAPYPAQFAAIPGLALWFPIAIARVGPGWLPFAFNGIFYYLVGVAALAFRSRRGWLEQAAIVAAVLLLAFVGACVMLFHGATFD